VLPSIQVPKDVSVKARAIAAKHGLAAGKWAAVFPGGLANVPVKAWPAGGFAEVVAWLQAKKKMPVLLLAHADEAATVDEIAGKAAKLGGARPQAWLGRDGELPLLA